MSYYRSWRCAQCGKLAEMPITREEANDVSTSVYDMPIPEGWVWHKYTSMRFPNRDSRTLGCCAEHARAAAAPFAIPEGM